MSSYFNSSSGLFLDGLTSLPSLDSSEADADNSQSIVSIAQQTIQEAAQGEVVNALVNRANPLEQFPDQSSPNIDENMEEELPDQDPIPNQALVPQVPIDQIVPGNDDPDTYIPAFSATGLPAAAEQLEWDLEL